MSQLFVTSIGAVLSADIAVPEHEREVRFYSHVLGTGDAPLWQEDLMNNLGMPIIGLGEQNADTATLPLQWMPHIQVDDVATSVKRTLELGGRVLMHEKDDGGTSQWAVLLDPNGAAFGIIPVVDAEAIPALDDLSPDENKPIGRIAWLDLTVPDASATRDFYQQVIGWSTESVEMKAGDEVYDDYNMIGANGAATAGICHARGPNADLPPVWMLYLPVGDLAESLRRVSEQGGKILKTVKDGQGNDSYAVVQDPLGVYLALAPG